MEEITESENSDNDDKMVMGDLSSNMDGYSGSKGVSTSKDNVEGSKDRITDSNVGLEALGEDEEKQSVHPSHLKRNENEEKMEEDTGKENEGKDLAANDNNLSKEEKEERTEKQDINTNIQINTVTTAIDSEIRVVVDGREESHEVKLSFLHTAKIKVEASLQGDSWLYNEIMVLKKKVGVMQKEMDYERTMRAQMEIQIGNIPKKLKEYEQELCYLIKGKWAKNGIGYFQFVCSGN